MPRCLFLTNFVHHAEGFSKEAEQAGYQAMQVTAEQAPRVPISGPTEVKQEIETPMDIDPETKDAGNGVKRKAEEEPSEESKKARVGVFSLACRLLQHPLKSSRTTPDS